ncbi:hypothetical protein [Kitasatospora sp. NPDC086791]|uniref:hypothetical protein n=1 Tax=Kitasatospora sp. NPDC086791 TaxID=3155178 RepID=UPI0034306A41
MYDLIRHTAERLRLLLAPGRGVHRRIARSPFRVPLRGPGRHAIGMREVAA